MRHLIIIFLSLFLSVGMCNEMSAQSSLMKTVQNASKRAKTAAKGKKTTKTAISGKSTKRASSSQSSLARTARQAQQRAKEAKERELSWYENIVDSRDLDYYDEFIAVYPRGKNTAEIKKRADEIRLWNSAEYSNTISAYQNYLSKTQYHWYDDEAESSIQSIKREQEKAAWDSVKESNTLEAYQTFLRNNPSSAYADDARQAIEKIEAAQLWDKIKNSTDIAEIQNYVSKYPNSLDIDKAKNRLYELKGCQFFKENQLSSAYLEFSKLKRSDLSYSNRAIYDEVMEYHEYSKLNEYSSEQTLSDFNSKHPNSKYRMAVNNMIAIAKAKDFSEYATESSYSLARSYAKDAATKRIVESYVDKNKNLQKERKRLERAYRRKQNGGLINIGLDFMDMGYNLESSDNFSFYYDMGVMLRIGNYADWVQFAVGIKPGIIAYSENYDPVIKSRYSYYDYGDDDSNTTTKFHMPILAQLKVNLFKMSQNSRFFVFGQYQYNAVRADEAESDMSWKAGLGFGWKNFDWSFYYRQDIGEPSKALRDEQHFIGMSLIYYWNL